LQDDIKDVRLSVRLTSSPACLVGDKDDLSPQLEQMMRQLGQDAPKTKRILEINPDHPFIDRLAKMRAENAETATLKTYAQLLHGQAILAEGGTLPDPGAYSRIVMDVANQAVGVSAPAPTDNAAPPDDADPPDDTPASADDTEPASNQS
jgi:molecular chaperone HtpG